MEWGTQLVEESLGSKIQDYNPKTLVLAEEKTPDEYITLKSPIDAIEDVLLKMMSSMYFLQVFVAVLAYKYEINFVTQDNVQLYKQKTKAGLVRKKALRNKNENKNSQIFA